MLNSVVKNGCSGEKIEIGETSYLDNGLMDMDVLKELDVSISDIERNSETDVEHKIIVPFLEKILGYTKDNGAEFKFRVTKNIPVGSRFERITPDIAIYFNSEPFLIVESKPINKMIGQEDTNEAVSNGRLYEFPKQFPYSVVSTGLKWEIYDTLSDYRFEQNREP